MTAMGCDAPRHAQDDWISAFIGSAPAISPDGTTWLSRVARPGWSWWTGKRSNPMPMVGPRWVVDGLISDAVVSSMPEGVDASLVFEADGNLSLDAGCNLGGGPYTVDAGVLRIGPLLLTRRGCQAAEAG